MAEFQIKQNLFSVGVRDPHLRRFDIVMETIYGSTYNSYIYKSNDKIVLIDGVKEAFTDEWLANIEKVVPISKIDYMVVQHTEPDHSGSIPALLKRNPNIEIFITMMGNAILTEIVNFPYKAHVIKDQEVLDLGDRSLRFIAAPNLHWPDTMFTYAIEDQWLFTCDFFGAHYDSESLYLSKLKDRSKYVFTFSHYFRSIMEPFKSFVRQGLAKIENLPITMVLNSHGPFMDTVEDIESAKANYAKWAKADSKVKKRVVISFVSSYGYTKEIATTIYDELIKIHDLDILIFDIIDEPQPVMMETIANADALMIGSPTIVGDALRPVYDMLNSMDTFTMMGKKATAFGSYGWSGEAVPNILERAKQLKMRVSDQGLKIKARASEAQKEEIREFARNFVSKL